MVYRKATGAEVGLVRAMICQTGNEDGTIPLGVIGPDGTFTIVLREVDGGVRTVMSEAVFEDMDGTPVQVSLMGDSGGETCEVEVFKADYTSIAALKGECWSGVLAKRTDIG